MLIKSGSKLPNSGQLVSNGRFQLSETDVVFSKKKLLSLGHLIDERPRVRSLGGIVWTGRGRGRVCMRIVSHVLTLVLSSDAK